MARKKYRYKKEVAEQDGVTIVDENEDGTPEALEVNGQREEFVETKELEEDAERPKGYEEVTEEEVVEEHTETSETTPAETHEETVHEENSVTQPGAEEHHETVEVVSQPAGETVTQPEVSAGTSGTESETSSVVGVSESTSEISQEEPTSATPVEKAEDVVSPAPAVEHTSTEDTSSPQAEPPVHVEEETLRPYEPPHEEQPAHVEETSEQPVTQPQPTETVTLETATGPSPEEHEEIVSPGIHDSVGGIGTEGSVDTSPIQPETFSEGTTEQPVASEETQTDSNSAASFAMTIKTEMENYCAAMGPGVMQTERSLVKNQVDLYYIFMKVLNVQDLDKFELGIKAIFTVMYQNKASCFDFNMRYRGIVDIPASTLKDDEVEVLTALIDLFCRLVDTEDLYTIGRTYNFTTLQRHLTDQFVLSRFLGFVRRIVGAA